ncbi:riboflavin biosynthesis protein RibF [Actinomyces sp. zg-332]|uniref:riboflavin biosynthesis protein RibF n=1 Tax=Actinomyces sp. zg-332 TaxID=2708340 RepID=UPI00141EB7CF|nr:riboflavin biosynthesis protein RibF [Actinomyces sp. zg-332]QPK93929.1 riboflavin biosynthesis protein RibF [Actinomyces sp. zg-332]
MDNKSSVVAIGIFDGFHLGHQRLIKKVVDYAKSFKCTSTVFTFSPHPANVHLGEGSVELLYPLAKRIDFLKEAGIDNVEVLEYSLEFAQQMPEEFVEKYFVQYANACMVVVGEDMRFGKGNCAGAKDLALLGQKHGFDVEIVENINFIDGERFSSTNIRNFIKSASVDKAKEYLGRNFEVFSKVVHGLKNGRKIGYPTANLDISELETIPKDGVYAGILTCDKHEYPCAISVGTNYQFDAVSKTVEAHVLGRGDLDFYEKNVKLSFVQYLRPMLKFDSLEDLLEQMRNDVCICADILNVPKPEPIDPTSVFAGM